MSESTEQLKDAFLYELSQKQKQKSGRTFFCSGNNNSAYINIKENSITLNVQGNKIIIDKDSIQLKTQNVDIQPLFQNVTFGTAYTINPQLVVPIPSSIVTPLPQTMFANPFQILNSLIKR